MKSVLWTEVACIGRNLPILHAVGRSAKEALIHQFPSEERPIGECVPCLEKLVHFALGVASVDFKLLRQVLERKEALVRLGWPLAKPPLSIQVAAKFVWVKHEPI